MALTNPRTDTTALITLRVGLLQLDRNLAVIQRELGSMIDVCARCGDSRTRSGLQPEVIDAAIGWS